jgi:S1-C subfamily serine protease
VPEDLKLGPRSVVFIIPGSTGYRDIIMSDDEANMVIGGQNGAAVVGEELQIADQVAAGAWKGALEHVVPCVVVLKRVNASGFPLMKFKLNSMLNSPCRVTQTRSFDTENAGSSYATGFVVDSKRGIILTNRHVVTPGPVVADAVFLNR